MFHRPHPTSLGGTEQVQTPKLLGVIYWSNFNFTSHVDAVLKLCSQRLFLLKQLRHQGMSHGHLHTIFQAIVLNCTAYVFPAWGPFLITALSQRTNGFQKRIFEVHELLEYAMHDLFTKIQSLDHCLYPLLPKRKDVQIAVQISVERILGLLL